jgi:hypothetical protein
MTSGFSLLEYDRHVDRDKPLLHRHRQPVVYPL